MNGSTQHVTSADGTTIAYESYGSGPAVILVAAAMNDASGLRPLAQALAEAGVRGVTYDRRGRGGSDDASAVGDLTPVAGAVERELDDLDALLAAVGGRAAVLGYSSGGHLALLATIRKPGFVALAMFEPPFAFEGESTEPTTAEAEALSALVAAGRRADAVVSFQRGIGLGEEMLEQIRHAPFFPALEALANSLVYDAAVTGLHPDPAPLGRQVRVPTTVMHGRDTWPELAGAARRAAEAIPGAELRVVEGANHAVVPGAVAAAVLALLARVPAAPGPA
ncbi:alpha/beta hydrolase [Georgenia sp. EYE_87]|uniref:alpha/beta fold hydrolase n=1 Tax=Georgenia sp. EYE_87 TaxID=2853448 RepID=UPI002002FCEE|nr:alpha/beta hydrolase [Georgenia sp. EYE_87]MCK6211544.1 alpha/beta hydrolase [Georgenia sp. EYE_87]